MSKNSLKNKKTAEENVDFLLNGPIYKGLFMLALPILVGNILQGSYQFIDAFWIAKLGTEAVAATSASGMVYFLILSLGTGFSMAGTILIAQYAGAKNAKMVNKSASQTLSVDIILAILLGAIGIFSAEKILEIMKVAPDVIALATPFLQITFAGMIFSFIFSMFQSILRGVGEVKFPMYVVGFSVILNIILDPIFIFGWGFVPAMGMNGAAWATMIVQAVSAIIGLFVLFKGKFGMKLTLSDMIPEKEFLKKIFGIGFPSSIEMSLRSFGLIMMTALVTSFGTVALAASGAGGYIFQMIFFPVMGFSIATSTMIGQNLGAGNLARTDEIAKKSMILSFAVLTGLGVLTYIFAPQIISLFIKGSPEALQMAVDLTRINAFFYGFLGIQFVLTGVFRAAGNSALAMNLGLVSMFVIQFPVAFLLSRTELGVNGVWWAYAITSLLMAIIVFVIYKRGKWKEKKLIQEDEILEEKVFEETMIAEGK